MKIIRVIVTCAVLCLISACSTIQQDQRGQPTEYLVPTSDFTMRLPPFVTIEVLKNARVPVIGTTQRDGKTFRVVLLPARAASGLRFLVNDDGTFEGSAINMMGERMGWSYTPVPGDARLIAEASAPQPASEALKPEQSEAIRAALDAHLAGTLKDPASAIQYAAGDPTECRNVVNAPPQLRDSWCVCYWVNAKNSMGGYTGAQLGVVSLVTTQPPYLMVDVPKNLIVQPAACRNVVPRDSGLIHALVK
ncbi:MAG: hypothetical protein ACYC9L_17190 [Sulfuricaulis sp.]